MFKVNKTTERSQWRCFGVFLLTLNTFQTFFYYFDVFFVNFEHISNLFLVFWLLTLNNHMVSFNSKLINFSLITLFLISWGKSLLAPNLLSANPWNGRTHSNNSSAINDELFMSLLDYFVGLALKGLKLTILTLETYLGPCQKFNDEYLKTSHQRSSIKTVLLRILQKSPVPEPLFSLQLY